MSATVWKDTLPAPPLHSWFEAFEADAQTAVHDLFLGRFDLANLAVVEPRALLGEWIVRLGNTANFSSRLDAAMKSWIETHWGNDNLAPRAQLLSVWETVAHVLSAAYRSGPAPAPLEQSAVALRDLLADPNGFSAQLFSPRGTDAFFACLTTAALYQRDESLRALWWRLAELPDGFPVRYASVALTGIRRLPAVSGGFRYDVAIALFTVARALSRRVKDGSCNEEAAVEDLQLLHELTRRQYPSMEQCWAEVFRQELGTEKSAEYSNLIWRYLNSENRLLPQATSLPTSPRFTRDIRDFPSPDRARVRGLAITWDPQLPREIKLAISRGEPRSVARAEAFLDQQRDYARRTGQTLNLVQSLHLFASEIRQHDLQQAESWVREELSWEPENVRGWSLLVDVLKRDHPNRAWQIAWAVADRFPFDPYVHAELADVLKGQGRLGEAEEVYRQMLDAFPDHTVASVGLADVIRLRVKFNELTPIPALDEAESLYAKVLEQEPRDRFARNGLDGIRRLKSALSSVVNTNLGSDDDTELTHSEPWNQTLDTDSNRTAEQPISAVGLSARPASRPHQWDATAYHLRLARVAFMRQSARRQSALPTEQRSISPERLRAGARKLIEEVLLLRPNDSRAQTELVMLAMDENTALPELHGESVAILAVAAQAARRKSKSEGYRLDNPKQRDEVLLPVRRLKSVHPAITPLVNLQEGLAHLALLDGVARLNAAAAAFTKLRNWARPHAAEASVAIANASKSQRSPKFNVQMWLSHALTKQLFEPANIDVFGQTVLLQADARHLSERLEEVGPIVSELELGFARHLSTPVDDLIGSGA